jgi:hypothetical protein
MSPRVVLHLLVVSTLGALATPDWAQAGDWDEVPSTDGSGGYDVQVDVEANPVTLETFQAGLSPHGAWVRSGTYGTAWRPRVAAGWRPYYFGRWEWTNEGWLWVSEEPFGWATYHYGRWAFDRGQGWLWVPGYQWAPAWVSWRFGGDVVGWAPLAPGLSLYVTSYAFVDFWWTFVPSARFCGTPVWGAAYAPSRAYQFYGVTSPAPPRSRPPPPGSTTPRAGARPSPAGRTMPAWGGPPARYIEERTGRALGTSRIVAEPRPGAGRGRPGEIGVYRPELAPGTVAPARRMSVERNVPLHQQAPAGRALTPGRGSTPLERSPPGAPRWQRDGERSQPPVLRQQAPQAAPMVPRSEPRPAPGPHGSPAPAASAAPHGGAAPRGEGPPPARAAPPRRER